LYIDKQLYTYPAYGGECFGTGCSVEAQWLCFLSQASTLHPSLFKHSPPVAGQRARNVCMAALDSSSPEPVMHANKQEGSAEQFLLKECGIEESKVDGVIRAAVAWRITPGGRQLIDRRRRSRIERNMLICAEYLVHDCGIEPGQCCD